MQPPIEVKFTKVFIRNQWQDSASGKTFATINPSTGEKICDVSDGDKADIDMAVAAAREAFRLGSPWRTMDASQRGRLLYKLADLLERDKEYLARLETLDHGKAVKISLGHDLVDTIACYRYFAGWADKIQGKTIPVDGSYLCITRHEPVGVIGQVIPWNYPIQMQAWKLAPALCAGNTIVLKPAEQTPLTALYVASLIAEAGFPPGVVNVVPGYGHTAGSALVSHPDVDAVAFTGSTPVGHKVMAAAAGTGLKRILLELGGKCPAIVFSDADLDTAAKECVAAAMENMGENCCAGSRTYVEESIYGAFVLKCVEQVKKILLTDPFNPECEYGPLVSQQQFDRIMSLISNARKEGAKLEWGGKRYGEKGYFVEPTIFSEVTENMEIAGEETFGPVMAIMKFASMNEVIDRANSSKYGLAASVFTKNLDTALTIAQRVRAGTVWINCHVYDYWLNQAPFGGYGESGCGRELGEYGLQHYVEIKTITIKIPQKNS